MTGTRVVTVVEEGEAATSAAMTGRMSASTLATEEVVPVGAGDTKDQSITGAEVEKAELAVQTVEAVNIHNHL